MMRERGWVNQDITEKMGIPAVHLFAEMAKMTLSHDNLQVVEADIFSADSLKQHLGGQDAVLSCLGFPPQKPKVT